MNSMRNCLSETAAKQAGVNVNCSRLMKRGSGPIKASARIAFGTVFLMLAASGPVRGDAVRLETKTLLLQVDRDSGRWSLLDKAASVRWPSHGEASAGTAAVLGGPFRQAIASDHALRLNGNEGTSVVFELVDEGRSLEIRYEGDRFDEVRVLGDALTVTGAEAGYVIVPCREGLLIPANSNVAFKRVFGTSDYEGCHMNMLGFLKGGAALIVSWDDAYVFPTVESKVTGAHENGTGTEPPVRSQSHLHGNSRQTVTASFQLRRSARSLRLTPLGKGDWNTIAAGYRRLAEQKRLAVTMRDKIAREPHAERLIGAANFKLWTCLARRMNEESTKEESVQVRWTFDEAAQIAEHLQKDVGISRCLFILGGWTEGGYDCRHPDNLPANPECGGNEALARAVARIQQLNYVACLHDNYQDMYRDAKSWNPAFIEKKPDGSLIQGGRWLGGRAYMVCAAKQLELALRPQNLPQTHERFDPWCYFIDTTYAVGPRECADGNHPIGRNDDIAWKIRLSDAARELFGLFGSECGREWALPHSDFFEGLVGVSGRYFHNLDPASMGATVIPFWEMVYHDCQVCYGKYGYSPAQAAEYVAHHVLCARPLNYHSIPDHLYWREPAAAADPKDSIAARPRIIDLQPAGEGAFQVRYAWDVAEDLAQAASRDWRVFVHFGSSDTIRFQDDHAPEPPVAQWRKGQVVQTGPRVVRIPASVREDIVNVFIGLFDSGNAGRRAKLPGCDAERRVLAGRLRLRPRIALEQADPARPDPRACFARTDNGWAERLHPTDAFLKTTHEVLGPLHEATAFERLTRLEFLTPDRSVRRATYGTSNDATTVVVNFGPNDAAIESKLGGSVLLPPWGFVVESQRFTAFYTKSWSGREYPDGALFTIQAVDGDSSRTAKRVRVFHGFGDPHIRLFGRALEVPRESIVP